MIEERGRVVYANSAYALLCGCAEADAMIGKTVSKLALRPPSERDYDVLQFPFRDGKRKLRLHVARDITARRALEIRLRESEKLEAIGRLVGGVAHDFNNILTAITLHSELLREQRLDPGARHVDEVLLAARRGTDLVRQLLTFARQHPSASQVVSLRGVLDSLRPVFTPLIGEDVELRTRCTSGNDFVCCDPAQLQQVFLNLVMNARDAMPKGGRISILISKSRIAAAQAEQCKVSPGNYVCLTIEDSGCGMKEQVRARIFEPFFSTKKPGSGTGLGMSMVYGIVTQAGGTVSVSSMVGKGTSVSILLPQAAAVAAQHPEQRPVEKQLDGSETILLAEDDDSVRASLAELLQARGYRVLQARDGMQALQIARRRKESIDLLLSDVVMPRMSGAAAATGIHRLHPETKVLLISGYPAKATPEALVDRPLLFKPFSHALLAQKVRETLEQRSPSSRAARGFATARGAS
jgi:two-component system cell cycle sensor histidine kinase/response regulator CckA